MGASELVVRVLSWDTEGAIEFDGLPSEGRGGMRDNRGRILSGGNGPSPPLLNIADHDGAGRLDRDPVRSALKVGANCALNPVRRV